MKIYQYEAFTDEPGKGNPAGIVFEGEMLTDDEMVQIARRIGFNETVFIGNSDKADIKLRYFTPGHEMNLCGHGTIAAIFALKERACEKEVITIETKAGILDVKLKEYEKNIFRISMNQSPAKFIDFQGDVKELAEVIGLNESEIDESLPIVYGNTGIWTLLIPIKKLESFRRMQPKNKEFPGVLREMERATIHPFCLETINPEADMHGRHFSSPYSGTVEDPVTGTASGVMGAYYMKYIKGTKEEHLIIEQGQEIGKNGIVYVEVKEKNGEINVRIEGKAVYVREIFLS